MSDSARTIFLSYASQDAAVAARLGEALRAAGIEVWFDQSELRGGDAWDQLIRRRIRECALFVPVISQHTQTRLEGYFRLEWRLAVERTHLMAEGKAFLVPVVIDSIDERGAQVPEAFRAVQWTFLPGGTVSPAFLGRVSQLLSGTADTAAGMAPGAAPSRAAHAPAAISQSVAPTPRRRFVLPLVILLAALAVAVFVLQRLAHRGTQTTDTSEASPAPPTPPAVPAAASAPAHSVAVLPFTNMSGDATQDYFSDGLSEELLNTLAAVPGLKVAARTSSFSFKGKDAPVGEIARKLNVATVLEGSVRRDKSHVRVSTELIDAATGFQRWSQTYDRDLKDVLALQSDIAGAVATALKVNLMQGDAAGAVVGGTDNPQAFDAFLRGEQLRRAARTQDTNAAAIAAYDAAIALDAHYANAYLARGTARREYAYNGAVTPEESHRLVALAVDDFHTAAQLAPALGPAHTELAFVYAGERDFASAAREFEQGYALSPGDPRTSSMSSLFLVSIGKPEEGVARGRHAVELDPLNPAVHRALSLTLIAARQYPEALAAAERALELDPGKVRAIMLKGNAYYLMGNYAAAAATCTVPAHEWGTLVCLALAEEKLGHHEAAQASLARLQKDFGAAASYQQAEIYAQWGDVPKALAALELARRTVDPGLSAMKTDAMLDPLRHEPRFIALQAAMKYPD